MGWSFTTHKDSLLPHQLGTISNFLAPSTSSSLFSGAVAEEEEKTSARGVFRTHILYFVIVLIYFIYFTCIAFYQKPKKIRILGSCYFFTFSLLCLVQLLLLCRPRT
jgi:O-antigen ligase